MSTFIAHDLACRRGDSLLFRALELELRPGDVVWLRGRNGRGKTSLLRLLAGLSTPAAGTLSWRDRPLAGQRADWCAQLVYIGHANAMKDDLTAREALAFVSRLHGRAADAAALDAALTRVGVGHKRHAPVRTLSQGQRRRVALARLALAPPGIWLLDEPYDALDVDGIRLLDGLISGHARLGGAVLFTSHQAPVLADPVPREFDLDAFAARAGDRVAA